MGIEEQLAAIEQRIGQLNIMVAGCTENAEAAAARAEAAAARAELAAAAGVNAAVASVESAVTALAAAEEATTTEPEPEPAEEIEDIEHDDDDDEEEESSEVPIPGRKAGEADNKPGMADTEPIRIRITTPAEPERKQQRRTPSYRFNRGR